MFVNCSCKLLKHVLPPLVACLFSVHAAVMAINEVLEKEDNDVTLKALKNPAACLVDVLVENAPRYQGTLLKAKRDKTAKAGAQVKHPTFVLALCVKLAPTLLFLSSGSVSGMEIIIL